MIDRRSRSAVLIVSGLMLVAAGLRGIIAKEIMRRGHTYTESSAVFVSSVYMMLGAIAVFSGITLMQKMRRTPSNFRRLRQKCGLSTNDLAIVSRVPKEKIEAFESGQFKLPSEILDLLDVH